MLKTYNYIYRYYDGGGGDIISRKLNPQNMRYAKNVTLSQDAIEIITGYMFRTHKNFSQTVDIIVKDWDKISILVNKIRAEQQTTEHLNKIKDAKVLK